jgi:RNA polymerase sigma-B factor
LFASTSIVRGRPTARQGRSDRDTATGRLLAAYRDQGDARARERLVELYMPLVEVLARRHGKLGSEHDDLVQVGSIGLLNAIERYDPKRGDEFVAFAVPTIAGEIKRHIRDRTATVRLPRRLQEASARLPRAREELTAKLKRAPTPTELAEEVGIRPDELARLENAIASAPGEGAEAASPGELDASESRLLLGSAFQTLDEIDRTILYLRFVRERSRRDVADELGISQSALARRTDAALARLRGELEGKAFKPGAAPVATTPPEPAPVANSKQRAGYSGRLMLRMPQSLHAELAEAAEREEVSLNQFITNTLAASLRWHSEDAPAPAPPRWLPAALLTNIVVVVIAGVIALVLLIVAWQQGW